jgi:SAM-dependent methyltransferase
VQLAEATATAAQAGLTNARFVECDLGTITDADIDRLPALDVVMLHGVWTWVSDAVRQGILRLLARRLAPGGLVYIGYNALPAAGADLALQRLLRQWAAPLQGAVGSVRAAEHAMVQLRQHAGGLRLPQTAMLQRLLHDPPLLEPAFVAHEFLTSHWRPVFHGDLCDALAAAKLEFVGSSNLFEALPHLFMEAPTKAVAASWPDRSGNEFLKDLCLPRTFRADVFVRGARRINPLAALDSLVLAACRPWPEQSPPLHTGVSEAALPAPLWQRLGAALQEGPLALGELRHRAGAGTLHPGELLALLVDTGQVVPVFRGSVGAAAAAVAAQFNAVAAERHAGGGQAPGHFALASPAAGGGVAADALNLALAAALARLPGEPDAHRLAQALAPGADAGVHQLLADRIQDRWPALRPVWAGLGLLPTCPSWLQPAA